MEIDNIECVSTSDGLEDEIPHHHQPNHHTHHHPHHHNHHLHHQNNPQNPQFLSSKTHNVNVVPATVNPTTSVHELLECPVCTNSMYPPIHQV